MTDESPTVIYTGTRRPKYSGPVQLVHHPLLKVEPAEVDKKRIRKRLSRAEVVVFYSRNAVDVARDLELFRDVEPEHLTALAVGPKTASYVEQQLDILADYPESSYSFENLTELLVERGLSDVAVASFELVDSPNRLTDEIDGDITSHGLYQTVPNDESIRDKLMDNPGAGLALTSPRAVRILADDPDIDSYWLVENVELGAIGPKTGEQITATIGKPSVELQKPDKTRLIDRLVDAVDG